MKMLLTRNNKFNRINKKLKMIEERNKGFSLMTNFENRMTNF